MNNPPNQNVRESLSYKCWLSHRAAPASGYRPYFQALFVLTPGALNCCAVKELTSAGERLFGSAPKLASLEPSHPHIALAVTPSPERPGSFRISLQGERLFVEGADEAGALYGAFALLRAIATGVTPEKLAACPIAQSPALALRFMQHWDNFDGSIERGYAGQSIFFTSNAFIPDMGRIGDYARLLASVGVNALCINNVNVHRYETLFITPKYLPDVKRIADTLRPYGIRLYLSVNFAAPIEVGGLPTADPLDEKGQAWWEETAKEIYQSIPDFGGFVVKADSEGRPGPFSYGRDHAQGANLLARALAPYGGTVVWRCFVYNCHTDWRDRTTDRARAAYDHFKPLDGSFDANVMLQIKNGPMDFQVREPVSPLFGALERTCEVAEFQITQEYTGQQKHICYLAPMWEEALRFDTYARGEGSQMARCIDGSLFGLQGGMAAVSNVGDSACWTGHPLAQINLYAFGRLAWDPGLTSEEIAREWITLTYGADTQIMEVLLPLLMDSRRVYESYTAPLGVGWMVAPNHHYGPDVDGYEYSRWGTYHFADLRGIGVDRTAKSGTGYTTQYHAQGAALYEDVSTCPDELLLFFHHVPYTHVLRSGKTVIQHIYDTHFEGAHTAAGYEARWLSLKGKIDGETFDEVLRRIKIQTESAADWRDIINTYFYRKSGIGDAAGRRVYP